MQREEQKNKIKFYIHHVPENLKAEIHSFINNLKRDGIFLSEISKKRINHFEINFLSELEIQDLNKEYRNIEAPTDVLSFELGFVGEIDLCLSVIKSNAEELKVDFLEEVFRCIIHGCLHALGYDHVGKLNSTSEKKEEMFILQESILKNVSSSSL